MVSRVDAVVDTSALVAVLFGEADADLYGRTLASPIRFGVSAANRTELLMVMIGRHGPSGATLAQALLARHGVTTLSVDEITADLAAAAFERYGKGRHPAGLNFGDCFSYAAARQHGVALLFKGEDFSRTDVPSLLPLPA